MRTLKYIIFAFYLIFPFTSLQAQDLENRIIKEREKSGLLHTVLECILGDYRNLIIH
jgi:hypothetical protein